MSKETASTKLLATADSFAYTLENKALQVEAMAEMVTFHRERSPIFDGICRQHGFDVGSLKTVEDIDGIPHIIVSAFKERKILSVPESEIVFTVTSSGTQGVVSQLNFDQVSLHRQGYMREAIIETYGLADRRQKVNYIVFNYNPETAGSKGAAFSDLKYTEFAPANDLLWAISKGEDGQPKFKMEQCVAKLEEYHKSGLPLRLIGFPSFSYWTLKHLDEKGVSFTFPPESAIIVGGGWKLHTGQAVSFETYAEVVRRVTGIARERIRDVYGMVEHGVPYITCEHNHFHIPIYGRVCAVDPGTLRVLPRGQRGLLKFMTPYIRSQPSISVLSTDFGEIHGDCECGREAPYLVLKGRGGVHKYAGCAISAAQLLGQ